jgi:hypothetical protein
MLKDPSDSNVVFDTSVLPKLVQPGAKRLAGACVRAACGSIMLCVLWHCVVRLQARCRGFPGCPCFPVLRASLPCLRMARLPAAGVVHEVALSRVGNLTCPVSGKQTQQLHGQETMQQYLRASLLLLPPALQRPAPASNLPACFSSCSLLLQLGRS